MKWKIFFWALCLFALFDLAALSSAPTGDLFPVIFHHIIFFGELIGLYAYIYNKKIAIPQFWKYFLWFNIILDVLSILYTLYPQSPYLQFYSFFYGKTVSDIGMLMAGVVVDIPLLYAMYRLSRGEYYIPGSNKIMYVSPGIPKWGFVQNAAWGYSFVLSIVLLLSSLLPKTTSAETSTGASSDMLYGLLMTAPIVLFWLLTTLQLKHYQKNWWRLTLLANGIFIALMMLGGMLFPSDIPKSDPSPETDFIGLLQFLVMIVALYVYGREQFPKIVEKKKITA